ncbi:4'-phosphopantetheinyl transferase superfamily protein [Ideonella sp.]|uniref:4'-phosphopantetheinyl transferase family protein n=1 Tax=Ideonella sp. TaxID=1929293 RepID=UPI0035B1BA6D
MADPVLAWQVDRVDAVLARAPAEPGWLSASEAARLPGLAHGGRRGQFLAGRWLLRELLARRAPATDPRDWALDGTPGRAPALAPGCPHVPGLDTLSLSHSGDWVAAAAGTGPLGMDIESWPPRRPRDAAALLGAICQPPEQAHWLAGPPEGLAWRLHVCWTLKEAAAKALGHAALPEPLRALPCRPAAPGEPPNAGSWHGPRWVAALCQARGLRAPLPAGWRAWCVDELPPLMV